MSSVVRLCLVIGLSLAGYSAIAQTSGGGSAGSGGGAAGSSSGAASSTTSPSTSTQPGSSIGSGNKSTTDSGSTELNRPKSTTGLAPRTGVNEPANAQGVPPNSLQGGGAGGQMARGDRDCVRGKGDRCDTAFEVRQQRLVDSMIRKACPRC